MRKLAAISSIALVCAIGNCWATASTDDATSPAATLAAFCTALQVGDSAAISSLTDGDAKQRDWVVAFGAHLKACTDLEQALSRRFGKDYPQEEAGISIREQMESARDDDLCKDLKRAKLRQPDGDTVLIIFDESGSDDQQGKLVRIDGHWKVEIESLSNYFSVEDTAGLKAVAAAAGGLAKDVTDGKFATLDDAAQAVAERLNAAESVGVKNPIPDPDGKRPNRPNQH